LKANTLTEKNDLSSVVNLTIDSEAQNHGITTSTIDLSTAGFASLANVVLKGIGDIVFGDINTSATSGIAFNGKAYSGHLHTGNLYAGDQTIRITTKGAITTGNLAASHIEIDLSKNITTIDGQYNNNIGTIILTPNLKNEVATLNYTTGISGTRGHQTDTQQIHVNANRANLILNGAGGSDKFHITASSFTKEIVLSGHLGSSRENQSDFVFIDLRQTNGCNVDMQNLVVNNSDNGVYITASKGQDSISLLANQNHDKISFNAGGPATAQPEKYSLNLAGTKLEKFQSFTLDGLTLTSLYVDGNIDAQELTNALYTHITQGEDAFKQTQSSILKDQTTNTYYTYEELFNTQGSFKGLDNKQGWEYNPQLIEKTDATTIKITSSEKSDVPDLSLNWEGNETLSPRGSLNAKESESAKAKIDVPNDPIKAIPAELSTTTIADILNNGLNNNLTNYTGNHFYVGPADVKVTTELARYVVEDTSGSTYTMIIEHQPSSAYSWTSAYLIVDALVALLNGTAIPERLFYYSSGSLSSFVKVYKDNDFTNDIRTTLVGTDLLGGVHVARNGGATNQNQTLIFSINNPTYEPNESITINGTKIDYTGYVPVGKYQQAYTIPAEPTKVVTNFESLAAGESVTFAGKSVLATAHLNGEEVANAFKGDSVSGAVVLGKWYQEFDSAGTMVAGIDANNVNFSVNGSKLTITDNPNQANLDAGIAQAIKGYGTDSGFMQALQVTGVNALRPSVQGTTKQGQDQETICADSYVNLTLSVAGNSSTKTEFVKNIDELGTLSSISNFELGIDKLTLYQFADDVQIDYQGELFEATHRASQSDLRITDRVYIDENGTTLQANIDAQGLIEFSHEASIESKAYLLRNIAQNKLAGFAHDEDFYVLASGNNPNATTDDLLIKLTGLGSMVLDVAMLLG
ncbi:MAG: hypothetical protein K2O85_02980, partial [Helicobacter sp.]|nr:hypothetical protein [Helicobacter sp.]